MVLGQLPPTKIAHNPKTNPHPNPNLNPNQGDNFPRGQLSGYQLPRSRKCPQSGIHRGLSREGEGIKHYFSSTMYGFCGSNVFHSVSLPFRMFIFLLTHFDALDCYYFGANLRLVSPMKVLLIKESCNVVF